MALTFAGRDVISFIHAVFGRNGVLAAFSAMNRHLPLPKRPAQAPVDDRSTLTFPSGQG
jgi:hypothetical protein